MTDSTRIPPTLGVSYHRSFCSRNVCNVYEVWSKLLYAFNVLDSKFPNRPLINSPYSLRFVLLKTRTYSFRLHEWCNNSNSVKMASFKEHVLVLYESTMSHSAELNTEENNYFVEWLILSGSHVFDVTGIRQFRVTHYLRGKFDLQ